MAQGLMPRIFVLFVLFVAKMASADVVIDGSSEIVLAADAPYATRLAAEELNFFLKGVLGKSLLVVPERTEGRSAIVLGGGHAGRVPLPGGACGGRGATALPVGAAPRADRDGYVIEVVRRVEGNAPYHGVVHIFGDDDDVADVAKAAALPDEAPWQPCFRRGTLFGVYAFLERFAGVRMYFPGELGTCFGAGGTRSFASDSGEKQSSDSGKKQSSDSGERRSCRFISVPEGRIEDVPAFSVRRYGYADGPVAKELLAGMDERCDCSQMTIDTSVHKSQIANVVGRDAPIAPQMDEIAFKRLNWYRLRMETAHLACCHGAKTHCLSPETWDAIYTNACAVLAAVSSKPPYQARRSGDKPPYQARRSGGRPPYRNAGTRDACPYQLPTTNYQLVFDAMPKDGFTWARHCPCDWCAKNIPFSKYDIGFATDLVWRRTAELARRLAAKFPQARVSQMSYIPYVRIPTNDIPDNVEVFVARRGPWAEGTAIGEREKGEVCGWHAKLGRKVSLWNYPDKVDCWNLEMKNIPQLAPRAWARYYHAVAPHVTGAFAESESDRWLYNYLNYYVFSRICWNPEADVEAILAEHHRLMFGAAAQEMAEFFDTLEKRWMKVVAKPYDTPLGPGVCHAPTEEELRTKIYSPQVLARLAALLDGAEAKVAAGSVEARRIALFRREYLQPLNFRVLRKGDANEGAADGETHAETQRGRENRRKNDFNI